MDIRQMGNTSSLKFKILLGLMIMTLLVLRIFIGIQINFGHEDYEQIYLIGLEHAYSGNWSYWGPDIVWSETRIAGGLQGVLAGVPLKLFSHQYAPIIFSNIISTLGLLLMAFYAKRRFKNLNIFFLVGLLMLIPYLLHHGSVLLNTSYLIFSGALLFIAVFELFLYRDQMIFKPWHYFFAIGFSLFFTYQLHLTWVMYIPFIVALLFLEVKENSKKEFVKIILFFLIGSFLSATTLIPTIIEYGDTIYAGADNNINFDGTKIKRGFELLTRYLGYSTFDINPNFQFYKVAANTNGLLNGIMISLRVVGIIQMVVIIVIGFLFRKDFILKRTWLLFGLTFLMSLILYLMSNKHLSSRTYILVYPISLWLALYSYNRIFSNLKIRQVVYGLTSLVFITFIWVGMANFNGQYSFKSVEKKLQKAIDSKDPYQYAKRRKTLMDGLN